MFRGRDVPQTRTGSQHWGKEAGIRDTRTGIKLPELSLGQVWLKKHGYREILPTIKVTGRSAIHISDHFSDGGLNPLTTAVVV